MAEGDFVGRAWEAAVPVLVTHQVADRAFVETLEGLAPDLVLVACFTQRLTAAVLRVPRHGCLNLHPSLLPAYRGPVPLFWQFRDGLTEIGVTVHWMDERLDTGDIAAQRPLTLPEGAGGPEADRLWAGAAAAMTLAVLADLERGHRPRTPQPCGGSYRRHPVEADFALSADWPARRAFVFMRGTEEWGRPYLLPAGSRTYALRRAVGYSPDGELPEAVVRDGRFLRVRFTPGVLHAQV
jgi:methionyl-tRNA formyltransferase